MPLALSIPIVPLPVIVPPVIGAVVAILVTEPPPVPAPIAVLKSDADNALTVLLAFILINLIALGFVSVNKLPPTVVAPKFVIAAAAVDAPVPPFATDKSAPDQSSLLILKVPPNVKSPLLVTVPVNVSPFTVPAPLTSVTVPTVELVPAPIKVLTSAAVMPVFSEGLVPSDKIAGVPVSLTTPKFVLAVDALANQ